MKKVRHLGLDVHAETIAAAMAEPDGEVRSLGTIPNTPDAVRKLIRRLGDPEELRACYEAGPTGYVLYWQLTELGVACVVVAPTLVPVKAGDRVKTDRRDAEKLARCHRAGDLTPVWVPDAAHEALRDLVRARMAAKRDQLRARHRLSTFLLRHGRRPPAGVKAWTVMYMRWVKRDVRFEQQAQESTLADYLHEVEHANERCARLERAIEAACESMPSNMRAVVQALQALRGVSALTAVTIVAELGQISRFKSARQLMGYSGVVSAEYSTGEHTRRGGITKTGNAHLRRIAVEAAWAYRYRPSIGHEHAQRLQGVSAEVKEIAWKAQHRLHGRYVRLMTRGKNKQKTIVAVARELLGFVWAIGVAVEQGCAIAEQRQAA